jgi:hypothetical protein
MKLRIQAQHLQPGDIVGSGEEVARKLFQHGIGLAIKFEYLYLKLMPMDAEQDLASRIGASIQ